jgi:CBS domain-containing protein
MVNKMQVGEKMTQNMVAVDITATAVEVIEKMLLKNVENAAILNGSKLRVS